MNQRILCITNCFPPQKFASSPQIGRLATYLGKIYEVDVVTSDAHQFKDSSLLDEVDGVAVHYAKKTKLASAVASMKGEVIKKSILPDVDYLTHFSLLEESQKIIERKDIQTVFTFGMPMSTHLAGLKLKRRFPHLKWMCVLNDPWVDNPLSDFNFLTKWVNKMWQDKCFEKADYIVSSSESYISFLAKHVEKSVADKIRYIPLSFAKRPEVDVLKSEDKLVIRYIGNFYGKRQPDTFLEALSKVPQHYLEKVRFEFVGSADRDIKKVVRAWGLSEIVTVVPEVSYGESLTLMRASDMLLVIDASLDLNLFLPSKLIEYIGARKPVFGVSSDGPSKKVITDLGFIVANPLSIGDITSKLTLALDLLIKGYPIYEENTYSIETIGAQFRELLEG